MKHRFLLLPLLFLSLIVFGCQEHEGEAGGEPMAEEPEVSFAEAATAVRTQFTQAISQSDIAGIAALYTTDAISYAPDGSTVQGGENIAAGYQGLFDMGINATTITPTETLDLGEWGWEVGAYAYTGQSAEGDTLSFEGEYSVLLSKVDGMWKLHRDVAFEKREQPTEEMMAEAAGMSVPESQDMVPEGIQALIDGFTEAVGQGDAAGAAAIYTADAHVYGADGANTTSTAEATTNYQEMFDAGIKTVSIDPVETVQQGDMAWQLGWYTFTGESAEGAAIMIKGEYAALLVQQDDMWKVHRNVGFMPRHAPSEEMADDAM